jgi:hypothetical protein
VEEDKERGETEKEGGCARRLRRGAGAYRLREWKRVTLEKEREEEEDEMGREEEERETAARAAGVRGGTSKMLPEREKYA